MAATQIWPFYLWVSLSLAAIVVDVVLKARLIRRLDRLADRTARFADRLAR